MGWLRNLLRTDDTIAENLANTKSVDQIVPEHEQASRDASADAAREVLARVADNDAHVDALVGSNLGYRQRNHFSEQAIRSIRILTQD